MYFLLWGYLYYWQPTHTTGATRQWPIISEITASVYVCMLCVYTHTLFDATACSEIGHCLRSAFLSLLNNSCSVWPGWSIIHQLAGSSSTLWFSFTKAERQPFLLSLCETLHPGLFIMPPAKVWAFLMRNKKMLLLWPMQQLMSDVVLVYIC